MPRHRLVYGGLGCWLVQKHCDYWCQTFATNLAGVLMSSRFTFHTWRRVSICLHKGAGRSGRSRQARHTVTHDRAGVSERRFDLHQDMAVRNNRVLVYGIVWMPTTSHFSRVLDDCALGDIINCRLRNIKDYSLRYRFRALHVPAYTTPYMRRPSCHTTQRAMLSLPTC